MKLPFLSAIAVALGVSAITAQAQSQLINVNFYSEFYQGERASGAAAIGRLNDAWNGINADRKIGAPTELYDSAGKPTSVTISYKSYGAVAARKDNIQPNENLMRTYLFNKKNDVVTVTLEHLVPNRTYTLYLYTASNDAEKSARAVIVTVNGITLTATGDPQTSFILASNYLQLTVPADRQGKIQIVETPAPTNPTHEADLNGLQLVLR